MNAFIPALLLLAQVVGGDLTYTVLPGDTLTRIGARFGVEVQVLAEENHLTPGDHLRAGQTLSIDNRHIAVSAGGADIIVNVAQRMLFHFHKNEFVTAYPIAAGKKDWRTPLGDFEITGKEEKPAWDVPASIQEEMRRSGKPVITRVPPSAENPLGDYWIGLSMPGIGVHGTNAPLSIYKLATHGCIRLHPDDIRDLFSKVDVGMKGQVVFQPVLIIRVGDSVYLEIHPDLYRKEPDALRKVLQTAESGGFLQLLDLALARKVIRERAGVARDVTIRN